MTTYDGQPFIILLKVVIRPWISKVTVWSVFRTSTTFTENPWSLSFLVNFALFYLDHTSIWQCLLIFLTSWLTVKMTVFYLLPLKTSLRRIDLLIESRNLFLLWSGWEWRRIETILIFIPSGVKFTILIFIS